MATEADILAPVCEARGEQGGNLADQASHISIITKHHFQDDTQNGLPTVEGDNFLTPPSVDEVHCEVNNAEKPNQKAKDETEGEGLRNARNFEGNLEAKSFESEKNTSTFIKEDAQIEYPAACEKVETQNEVLEKLSSVSNEDVNKNSVIKSDGSEAKDEENETQNEDEELRKAAMGLKIESQIERQTGSSTEDQSVAIHPQEILDAAKTEETLEKEEQGGNLVQQAIDNSIVKLPKKEQFQDDKHNELPTVEGENFLRPLSTGEVHCEGNSNAPDVSKVTEKPNHSVKSDDKPLEDGADEERSSGEIPQNAEEAKGLGKDESNTTLILEGEELTTDKKTVDGKTKEEDIQSNLSRDMPEGECDQHKIVNPAKSLHEDQSTNAYLREGTGGDLKEKTVDPVETEKEIHEDCSEMEHMGKDSDSSLTEAPTEEINAEESEDSYEPKDRRGEAIKAELEDNSPIEEDGLRKPSLEEATTGNSDDVVHEAEVVGENEKNTECTNLVKEEVSIESMQVGEEDIKASALSQDRETSCLLEQSVTTNPQEIMEDKTDYATSAEEETPEEKTIAETTSCEGTEENLQVQVDSSKQEHNEDFEVATDGIEASASCQETIPIEEKIPTSNSQEIPRDKTDDKITDSAYTEKENLESFSTDSSVSSGEQSINAVPREVPSDLTDQKIVDENDTQEVLEKFSSVSNEDVNENSVIKSDGSEMKNEANETPNEDEELKKAAMGMKIESQIARETDFRQEREIGSSTEEQCVTTHPQGILDENTEEETINAAETKEETLEKEEGGNLAEQVINGSTVKLPNEEPSPADTHYELPTVEGENFSRPLSASEVYCEGNRDAPDVSKVTEKPNHTVKSDDQPLEIDANEERSSGEIQQNAEESKGLDKDETKEPNIMLIQEEEELNVQGETRDEKTGDGKTTEDDISSNLKRDVPEGECDQHKMSPEEEGLENGISSEHKLEAELFESEQNASTLLKEDAQIENPAESLHEDQSTNAYLQGGTGGDVKGKTVDPVETEKEIHEDFSEMDHMGKDSDSSLTEAPTAETNGDESEDSYKPKFRSGDSIKVELENNLPTEEDGSQKPSLEESATGNSNNVGSTITHEGELVGENEENTECTNLVKEEVSIEQMQVGDKDIKASALGQDRETSSLEEHSLTTNPQEIMEDKTNDATGAEEESPEEKNIAKTTSHEGTEENLQVQVDSPQQEQKEDLGNDGGNTSSTAIDSLQIAPEDIEASASCQETSPMEEQILTSNSQEIPQDKTDEKVTDSAYIEKENLESFSTDASVSSGEQNINAVPREVSSDLTDHKITDEVDSEKEVLEKFSSVSNEDVKENSVIKSDGSETKDEVNETQNEDEELRKTAMGLKIESQIERETDLGPERKTGSSTEEKSVATHPQEIHDENTEDETIDGAETKEETLEVHDKDESNSMLILEGEELNVQGETTDEKTVDGKTKEDDISFNLTRDENEEDCNQHKMSSEQEALGNGRNSEHNLEAESFESEENTSTLLKEDAQIENPAESLREGTGGDVKEKTVETEKEIHEYVKTEDETIDEAETKEETLEDEEPSKGELFQEKHTENGLLNEEVQSNKPVESLQYAPEDHNTSGSSEDIVTICSPKEVSLVMSDGTIDATETKEVQDVAENIPSGNDEDESTNAVDGSHKLSSTGNTDYDESAIIHDTRFADENVVEAKLFENERNIGRAVVKEDEPVNSLKAKDEDTRASGSSQDGETSHVEEESLITDPQGIMGDPEEGKTFDGTEVNGETPDDKNFGLEIPHELTEESSVTQVDCLQKEDLEKDNENSFLTEASAEESNADESKDIHELKDSLQAELDDEENTGTTSFQEEAHVEKSIESSQPAPEDITASDRSQDTNTSIEKSLEVKGIATNIPDKDNEDSSPIEEDGSQKPSTKEATAVNNNDEESPVTPEAELVVQNEKDTECPLVKEDVSIKSSQEETQDIKKPSSGQDKETSSLEEQSLNTNAQGIIDDTKEEGISDATGEEEETLEDKNIAKGTSYEEMEENVVVQVDRSGLELNEVLEKDGGETSLSEAPKKDATETILVKEEALVQDHHIESLQVGTEVIEARSSCQETSSVEEIIPTADSQEISCEKAEEKSTDLKEETPEDKSSATTSNEDTKENSLSQEVCSKLENREKDGKSTSLTEAPTTDTTESTLVKEVAQVGDHIDSLPVATDDIKAFARCQETETSSTEEQVLTVDPEDISRDNTNEKTEVQDTVKYVREDNSPAEEDGSQKPSFEEASTEDADDHVSVTPQEAEFLEESSKNADLFRKEKITEGTSVEEDVSSEPPQVAAEDIKASSSSEEREAISQAEQILNANPGGSMSDDKEEKTIDPTDMQKETSQDEEVQVPDGEQKAQLVQQDSETETAQKGIEEQLLTNASQAASEYEVVNDEEEKLNSDNCKEISGNTNSVASTEISPSNVALEEDSTSDPFQEPKRQTREEAENEEAQEQEEEVHVSALNQDSSMEKVEKDVQWCVASAIDSDITQKMSELEEPPLLAPDVTTTETTEFKETEVLGREVTQDTEELHSERTATDESVTKIDKDRIDEDESSGQKRTDFSPAAENMTEARNEDVSTLIEAQEETFTEKCTKEANENTINTAEGTVINESTSSDGILVNNRSITDLESKLEDKAPEISETTPTATEGQDSESTSVGEISAVISKCERDGYDHANIGSLNEEKLDSNEVAYEMGKPISDIKEIKTEERNLEAAAETKSGEAVSVDISEQEETTYEKEIMEDNILGEKTKEGDEDVEGYHRGSCEEEVNTESHLGEEAKQEEKITTEETSEVIKIENSTENVPETSKEADDRVPKESQEEFLANTKEAHELDITCEKTRTQDSNEEINSSPNEKAIDEGLLTRESHKPEKDAAAARELAKGLDEHITCEAPPTSTVHNTTADSEAKKENTNTIAMQQQEQDSTPTLLPLLQSAQGKEGDQQNQKDEICRSDEVQTDFEDNMMLSATKLEEENKADTWSKPNEDTKTSLTKDILEVPIYNDVVTEVQTAGLNCSDVTELEVTPLPSKDKHEVLEADQIKNLNPENPNGDENISTECSEGERETLEASKIEQQDTDQETREKPDSEETNMPPLSDLLQVSKGETMENLSATGKTSKADAKPDVEKDEEDEEKGSEAPVMVDMGDADVKASHKKSNNILSGVGSKVKHSIAKVKKAITGKSSHPKPPSPKKVVTCEK